ncbi:hypothetical protein ACFLYA_01210 [Candidatus Dependentiae bacterium]
MNNVDDETVKHKLICLKTFEILKTFENCQYGPDEQKFSDNDNFLIIQYAKTLFEIIDTRTLKNTNVWWI